MEMAKALRMNTRRKLSEKKALSRLRHEISSVAQQIAQRSSNAVRGWPVAFPQVRVVGNGSVLAV